MTSTARTPEPRTEAQAQALKRFLERGASTTLEAILSIHGKAGVRASLAQPATVSFETSTGEVLSVVGESSGRRVFLSFGVSDVVRDDQFLVHVFANAPDASAQTQPTDPRFVATISFFCEKQGAGGDFVCIPPNETVESLVDLQPTLTRIQNPSEPLSVTFVLVPLGTEPPTGGTMIVRDATVLIYASEVKQAS